MPKSPSCTCGSCAGCWARAKRRIHYHQVTKADPERLAKHRAQSNEGRKRYAKTHREHINTRERLKRKAERDAYRQSLEAAGIPREPRSTRRTEGV